MVTVVQCWDDGVVNDIRLTGLLRKYKAKATFNLNPGFHSAERGVSRWVDSSYRGWSHKGFCDGKVGLKELPEVYSGFQVASHCMKHETVGTLPDDQFLKAAVDARHFLEDLFQRECRGFAWPCGRYTKATADALLAAGFAYGRTVENTDHVGHDAHPLITSSSCHFQDNQFYQRYENVKKENGIFYFWGHSYEMLDSEGLWSQFEQKLKFISEDKDAVWKDVIAIAHA